MNQDVLCVILGGGRGTRLYPLTRERAKPAVPLFGKYRLIDIPISNCINSGFFRINILTQFNSESLNKHVSKAYKFEVFSGGFIEIIAADQTADSMDWFQGTADAVRRSLRHFNNPKIKYVLILSGDQLYKMNLRKMYEFHKEKDSQVTIACNIVPEEEIHGLGIMGVDRRSRIQAFVEKPKTAEAVRHLAVTKNNAQMYLSSMGIYLFNADVLREALNRNAKPDFGREIIPECIAAYGSYAYQFDGYWRDIGTISSFYSENLQLTEQDPPLDLYDEDWPIFTRSRHLPPSRVINSTIERSMIADGVFIESAQVKRSIIGLRSKIGGGSTIEDSIVIGADYYESDQRRNKIPLGIGCGCRIRKAIIDKNVRIGNNVSIINPGGLTDVQGENYAVRDGITVIFKNAVIPDGTVI